jgi:Flp pilus assembly pilin Flp
MVSLFARLRRWGSVGRDWCSRFAARVIATGQSGFAREDGQTTAEYALVILAAAAVAVVLIAWAKSSGKLPAFFDKIIDDITANA